MILNATNTRPHFDPTPQCGRRNIPHPMRSTETAGTGAHFQTTYGLELKAYRYPGGQIIQINLY